MGMNFNGITNTNKIKEVANTGKALVSDIKIPKLPEIISKGRKELLDMVERMVPENGKFFKVGVTFDIPDTSTEAVVAVMHDENAPKNLRRLNVGIHHQNSDKMFSTFTKKGTKQEIMKYLKQPNCESEILEQINSLTKQMEEHYSSL